MRSPYVRDPTSWIRRPAECETRLVSPRRYRLCHARGYRGTRDLFAVKRVWQIAEKAAPVDAHDPHKCHRERVNVGGQQACPHPRWMPAGERNGARNERKGWKADSPFMDRYKSSGNRVLINERCMCCTRRKFEDGRVRVSGVLISPGKKIGKSRPILRKNDGCEQWKSIFSNIDGRDTPIVSRYRCVQRSVEKKCGRFIYAELVSFFFLSLSLSLGVNARPFERGICTAVATPYLASWSNVARVFPTFRVSTTRKIAGISGENRSTILQDSRERVSSPRTLKTRARMI